MCTSSFPRCRTWQQRGVKPFSSGREKWLKHHPNPFLWFILTIIILSAIMFPLTIQVKLVGTCAYLGDWPRPFCNQVSSYELPWNMPSTSDHYQCGLPHETELLWSNTTVRSVVMKVRVSRKTRCDLQYKVAQTSKIMVTSRQDNNTSDSNWYRHRKCRSMILL